MCAWKMWLCPAREDRGRVQVKIFDVDLPVDAAELHKASKNAGDAVTSQGLIKDGTGAVDGGTLDPPWHRPAQVGDVGPLIEEVDPVGVRDAEEGLHEVRRLELDDNILEDLIGCVES